VKIECEYKINSNSISIKTEIENNSFRTFEKQDHIIDQNIE